MPCVLSLSLCALSLALIASADYSRAQDPSGDWCAFEPPATEPAVNYLLAPTGPIRVPVVFHVFYNDAGVGNHDLADLQTQIDTMNMALDGSDITLFLRGVNRVEDNALFENIDSTGANGSGAKQTHYVDSGRVLNVYLGHIPGSTGGYAQMPVPGSGGIGDAVTVETFTIPGNPWRMGSQPDEGGTFVHEVGHWLGLYHTFQGSLLVSGRDVPRLPQQRRPSL